MPFRLAILLLLTAGVLWAGAGGSRPQSGAPQSSPTRDFSEQNALGVLQHLGDALESHDLRRFLSAFDADKLPDYPVFRDQVNALFQQYESFQVSYKLNQVAMDGRNGVALADFTIDARPTGGDQPDVRKSVSLRLVLGWNGKEWKIADLSPREFFS
jgi:hypothetical protein